MIINLDLAQDLYNGAPEIARAQQPSVADLLASACAEHIAAWDRLEPRAQRGNCVEEGPGASEWSAPI